MLRAHRLRLLAAALAFMLPLSTSMVAADDGLDADLGTIAEPAGSVGAAEEIPQAWFVQLASPPSSRGTSSARLSQERDGLRAALVNNGIGYRERSSFETLWNGLSLDTTPSNAAAIGRIAGVTGVFPVVEYRIPETTTVSDPDLSTALPMTGADVAQAAGWTGQGVKVGVIDSGIDYQNPDLGGCFGSGCRVAVGRDFVGDAFDAGGGTARQTTPRPDNDPDDCGGHGTHVAGIIGANGDLAHGGVRGVAPDVTFGAYRVFGCDGSTTADIMLAAMERALADGMQVVNMSIGSSFQWPTYPTAVAANSLVDAGVVVVASIGNSGPGVYSTGAPGNGDKVIGVASFDNTANQLKYFTVTPDDRKVGYNQASGAPTAPTSGTSPLARTGTKTTTNDACNAVAPAAGSLTAKVALIRRGTCSFYEKSRNAELAGAIGVVIYNNAAGVQSITVAPPTAADPAVTIPVVSISDIDGALLNDRLAAGAVDMTWTDRSQKFPSTTANRVSSFSSYGLSPDLTLKPDIGAPGGNIYSTLPLEQGGHGNLSGTSMSSPHVAGGVAAFLEAHPGTPAADVRTILQNSADPKTLTPASSFIDSAHRQGAGMLDIPGAINAGALLTPGKLSLREVAGGASVTRIMTIKNTGAATATFALSHTPALTTTTDTFSPSLSATAATVSFSPASVEVAAGAEATVTATITAPVGPFVKDSNGNDTTTPLGNVQFGGYLVATGGGATYRVPYGGFRGDYQSIVALTPTANGLPWLAKRVGATVDAAAPIRDYAKQSAGAVFRFKKNTALDDVPRLLFHLDHQVSHLTIDLFTAAGEFAGRVMDSENFGRNSSSTAFFAVAWDGKSAALDSPRTQNVKSGSYHFKITVLKALGDPTNAAHLETWESPNFTVDREADDVLPTMTDARVTTNAAPADKLGAGDVAKLVFSEVVLAPAAGSTFRVADADGTQADIVCGTNASCALNTGDTTLGGITYAGGRVLTVTITALDAISGSAGTVAGVQLPASITAASGITDVARNPLDLATSTDTTIDVE